MALSWGTIKSLLIFFGPLFIPKIIGYYRSVRNAPRQPDQGVRPCPKPVLNSLAILALTALVLVIKTLPVFSPENVFAVTNSRLQIKPDVLFTRLSTLRPLTPLDDVLRARFVNLEARLLYLAFGPEALGACPFCSSDDPQSFLFYALPPILALHLLNAVVLLALATSSALTRGEGSRWRTAATVACAVACAVDVYTVCSYNYQSNARALRLSDLDAFFWRARRYRHFALAGLDLAVAALTYLSSTRRAFFSSPTPADRVEAAARNLASTKSKFNAVGIVKNTASRDAELRSRSHAYWAHEVGLMREVMEDREVVEGVNDALGSRIDMGTISRDAESYAQGMLSNAFHGVGPPTQQKGEKSE